MTSQYSYLPVKVSGVSSSENPLLKWPGGKSWLAPYLVPLLLPKLGGEVLYCEPFAGGAALFFALRRSGWSGYAVLSDLNADLINLYRCLNAGFAGEVFGLLSRWESEKQGKEESFFLELREKFNGEGRSLLWRAAATCFLSKAGFNGLWRTNKEGEVNQAYGGARAISWCLSDLVWMGEALQKTLLLEQSFIATMLDFGSYQNTVWYCDPPYWGTWGGYTKEGFSQVKQEALGLLVRELAARGAVVLVSNLLCEETERIYQGAQVESISQRFTIGGSKKSRANTQEGLFSFNL